MDPIPIVLGVVISVVIAALLTVMVVMLIALILRRKTTKEIHSRRYMAIYNCIINYNHGRGGGEPLASSPRRYQHYLLVSVVRDCAGIPMELDTSYPHTSQYAT